MQHELPYPRFEADQADSPTNVTNAQLVLRSTKNELNFHSNQTRQMAAQSLPSEQCFRLAQKLGRKQQAKLDLESRTG